MTDSEQLKKDLEKLARLRPIDDVFIRMMCEANPAIGPEMLRVLIKDENLDIDVFESQKDRKRRPGVKSAVQDTFAAASSGSIFGIEVQSRNVGNGPDRAFMNLKLMSDDSLRSGQDYSELPDAFVIFITGHDPFGEGKPMYRFEWMSEDTYQRPFKQHILFVNGQYRGDDPIGRLMHDMFCSNPDDMYNPEMRKAAMYLKDGPKGRTSMCEILEEVRYEEKEATAKRLIQIKHFNDLEVSECTELPLSVVVQIRKEILSASNSFSQVSLLTTDSAPYPFCQWIIPK